MSDKTGDTQFVCASCGNKCQHEVFGEHRPMVFTPVPYDPHDEHWHEDDGLTLGPFSFVLSKCRTCRTVALYKQGKDSKYRDVCLWPSSDFLGEEVPDDVQAAYSEAYAVKERSPNAFATQLRRSVEALCLSKGVPKGDLKNMLEVLFHSTTLPSNLMEIVDVIRIVGNQGAHFHKERVTKKDAETIDEFFRALVEYVFIAPARAARYQAKLAELKSQS